MPERMQGLDPRKVWTTEYVEQLMILKRAETYLAIDNLMKIFFSDCESLLDVGAGFDPPQYGPQMICLDISPNMIALGRELYPELIYIEGSAYNLPFPDNQFDAIQSYGMLRHMKEWEPALKEMIRVCKKKLVFTHLIGKRAHKCGAYQWCVRSKDIERVVKNIVETRIMKAWAGFKVTLFMVILE